MAEYGKNGTEFNLQHIQMKFDLAANWAESTVLLAGEIGVEKDTHKFKVGDGATAWKDLPYSADPNVQTLVNNLTERVDTAETTLTSHGTRLDAIDGEEGEIAGLKAKDTTHESRMATIEAKDTEQDGRLTALEGITTLSANPFRDEVGGDD